MTTRRDVLRGAAMIAAAPTALATPAIAPAGDTSPARAALTTFRQVHAERAAVVEQLETLQVTFAADCNKLVSVISVPEWWCGHAF